MTAATRRSDIVAKAASKFGSSRANSNLQSNALAVIKNFGPT
jgi:hypothetical protein